MRERKCMLVQKLRGEQEVESRRPEKGDERREEFKLIFSVL